MMNPAVKAIFILLFVLGMMIVSVYKIIGMATENGPVYFSVALPSDYKIPYDVSVSLYKDEYTRNLLLLRGHNKHSFYIPKGVYELQVKKGLAGIVRGKLILNVQRDVILHCNITKEYNLNCKE